MNERRIIQALAFAEADSLWQIPSYVHILTDCIIRAQSADFDSVEPFISETGGRQWAAANLESQWPQGEGRYTGPLDLVYTIEAVGRRIKIVGHSLNEPEESHDGNGKHSFIQMAPEWDTLDKEAMLRLNDFLTEATRDLAEDAPPGKALSVVMNKLLDIPQIQECLASLELDP